VAHRLLLSMVGVFVYKIKMADFEKFVCVDEKALSERMCLFVVETAKQAVKRSGKFTIGLSGSVY